MNETELTSDAVRTKLDYHDDLLNQMSKLQIGIIFVLLITVLTLLFALAAILRDSWSDKAQLETQNLEKIIELRTMLQVKYDLPAAATKVISPK